MGLIDDLAELAKFYQEAEPESAEPEIQDEIEKLREEIRDNESRIRELEARLDEARPHDRKDPTMIESLKNLQVEPGEGTTWVSPSKTVTIRTDKDYHTVADFFDVIEGNDVVIPAEESAALFAVSPRLLAACEKILNSYDAVYRGDRVMATWSGKDVDEMRAAVIEARPPSAASRS